MKRYIRSSRYDGFIGLWWITDDYKLFGPMKPVEEGVLDGRYIQIDDQMNHMNTWKTYVYSEFSKDEADNVYKLGYRGLERGRVIYDTMTQVYVITCSNHIAEDLEALNKIKAGFNLTGCRVEVEILDHYKKIPLTGNPAVDSQILNMDV